MARKSHILHEHFLKSPATMLNPRPPIIISSVASCAEAISLINKHNIGSILVTDAQGKMSGIFTERDVITKLAAIERALETTPVGVVMTEHPVTVPHYSTVAKVLHTLSTRKFRHLPVMDREASVLGVISVKDILRFLHERFAKKILNEESIPVFQGSLVDQFFSQTLSSLPLHAPVIALPSATVREAVHLMVKHRIGSVLIADQTGELQGIFSERDYLTKIAGSNPTEFDRPLANFMKQTPRTALSSTSIALTLDLMAEGHYRHMPVVEAETNKVIGICSVRTFVDQLAENIVADLQ